MSEVRYYTDEHIALAIVAGLRQRGIDVLTTQEAGMIGASDEAQLARARAEGRVTLSQDDDFLRLHAQGLRHSGIAYAPQRTPAGPLLRGLVLIYQVRD